MDELEAIRGVISGDIDRFSVIVELYQARLDRWFRLHSPFYVDIESAVQDTFIRAYRSLPRFRPESCRFSTWLLAIARHVLLDHLRRSRRRVRCESLDELLALGFDAGTRSGPAERYEQWQRWRRFLLELNRLPKLRRHVFILCRIVRLSYKEAAQRLRVPYSRVRYAGLAADRAVRALVNRALSGRLTWYGVTNPERTVMEHGYRSSSKDREVEREVQYRADKGRAR